MSRSKSGDMINSIRETDFPLENHENNFWCVGSIRKTSFKLINYFVDIGSIMSVQLASTFATCNALGRTAFIGCIKL